MDSSTFQLHEIYNDINQIYDNTDQTFEIKLNKLKEDYFEAVRHRDHSKKWSGPNYITKVNDVSYNVYTSLMNEKHKNYATFRIQNENNKFPDNKNLRALFGNTGGETNEEFDIYFPEEYTFNKQYKPLANQFWENLNITNLSNYATNQRNEKLNGINPLKANEGGRRLRKTKTKTMGKRIRRLRKRTHRYIRR